MSENNERRHVLKYTPVETVKTDFNIVDQCGRKVGHRADIVQVDTRLAAPDATSCHLIPKNLPMTFYEVRTHATRNGEMYGAGQGPDQKCASFPEAVSVARAKAASSLKSYERKFIKKNAKVTA